MVSATGAPCDNTCSNFDVGTVPRTDISAGLLAVPAGSLFRIDHQKRHGTSRGKERERVCDGAPGLTACVPADQYLVADRLGFPAARYDENGSAAGEQELFGRLRSH